jgi:hypothetical protein
LPAQAALVQADFALSWQCIKVTVGDLVPAMEASAVLCAGR